MEQAAEHCSADDGQERAVLLVDRVSTAVTRQLEALTVELAASRERIEALARENGALEREVALVRQVSDADQRWLQAELDQARARIAELERPPEPAPDPFSQPISPSPNAAPWWRRWVPWLASAGLAIVVGGSSYRPW